MDRIDADPGAPLDRPRKRAKAQREVGPMLHIAVPGDFNGRGGLVHNAKGDIKPIEHNAQQLLARDEKLSGLRFDDFLYRPRIDGRDWSDHDDRRVLIELQSVHGVSFTLGHVRTAAMALAYSRHHDSLIDFVNALPEWDGTARIEHALCDAWGVVDDDLTRAASRNFFIALIARALRPGCQVDTLLALEGKQGKLKSKSLRTLFREYHAEITAHVGTTDFYREMRGLWCPELSELDSLRGRDASTIKRVLSAPVDRFVEKYEKHAGAYPRRAVIVATTNEAEYWRDPTGARRLVPVKIGDIRLDLIELHRLQWFAEARQQFDAGASWWEFPEAEIAAAQDERQEIDPWEDILRGAISHGRRDVQGCPIRWPEDWIASEEIMRDWLKLEPHQQGKPSSTRLRQVMRALGFIPKRKKINGKPQERGWVVDTSLDSEGEVST